MPIKSKFFVFKCLFIIILLLLGGCRDNKTLSKSIIKEIDSQCGERTECTISMERVTSFEWDKLVVFQVGSSNKEVSNHLGFEYNGSTDLMSGLIFVLDNKIVFEEKIPYNPEKGSELQILFDGNTKDQSSAGYNLDNAIFTCKKNIIDGVTYYTIIAKSK
ncbi:hypothetical protein [Cohnella sp. GCM10012308]|uniref:hypothetical protein n=1 Tax=Cohnella sp. GCM10012308 TaxID=3317329 RepID=UPI0036144352